MSYVKVLNGYEIHSNAPINDKLLKLFNPNILILLKHYIRQYSFIVKIEKEWGLSLLQCYNLCLNREIIAFGIVYRGQNQLVLSIIGYNRHELNFHKFYHKYEAIKKTSSIFLMFPHTMILNIEENNSTCSVCGFNENFYINNREYCKNYLCEMSNPIIQPKDLKFGDLRLDIDNILKYTIPNSSSIIDYRKMLCKYCRTKRRHKNCSYNRQDKKLHSIKSKILQQ